jgi:ABC-2 type transport system permease protein
VSFVKATRLSYTQALAVELIYRFALAQSFLGVAVGFVGVILFWLAAGAASGPAAAYTPGLLVAYFLMVSAHSIIHENRLSWNLSAAIRMGKVSAAILRPYPYLVGIVATAAAHATVRLALITPLVVLAFALVPVLAPVAHAVTMPGLGLYAGAMVLSFAAGWAIRIALGLLAFDMTQTWGPELIFMAIYTIASGVSYPPDLLPPVLVELVSWTPVYYMIGFPALVLLGKISGGAVAAGFAKGVVVVAATLLVVAVMWKRGLKRFEAVGI